MQLSQGATKGAADQLQLDLTAKTYRYLDDEEQAAVADQQRKSKKNGN
jgi:Tfp pilus assembly protein PilO